MKQILELSEQESVTLWHHLKGVEEAGEEFADAELISIRKKLEE